MFAKLITAIRLVKNGEYSKIKHSLIHRLQRILGKNTNSVAAHQTELTRVLREIYDIDNQYQPETLKVALIVRGGALMPQSSAFIRLISPLSSPELQDKLSLKIYPENTTRIDEQTDIAIVQRTAFNNKTAAKSFVRNLSQIEAKLVVDTDDGFAQLDRSHQQYKEQFRRVGALNYVINHTNELWLSTERLASTYPDSTPKVIMHNTLDLRLWQHQLKQDTGRRINMLYMGTATHQADFQLILPVLNALAEKYPDTFTLTIIGVADEIAEKDWIRRIRQPKFGAMYPNFVKWFTQLGSFDVGLAPLVDNDFNASKSDIKCLDYLAAGIMPVVSDVPAYSNPELDPFIMRNPNTDNAWQTSLEQIIKNPTSFRRQARKRQKDAWHYIQNNRSSTQLGLIMHERLCKLSDSVDHES